MISPPKFKKLLKKVTFSGYVTISSFLIRTLRSVRYGDLAHWFGFDSLRFYVPVDIEASEIVPIGWH